MSLYRMKNNFFTERIKESLNHLMKYFISGIAAGLFILFPACGLQAQGNSAFKIARVQYQGGGDWYNSPTTLTNMARYANEHLPISIEEEYDDVQIGSRDIFDYPFLYISGHGNITLNNSEMENLRRYLENGGFLYIDDDYGMDPYVRPLLERLFPDEELLELPGDHPVYNNIYSFPSGRPPKIHEHDGEAPQAFAIYREGRMVLLYTYESNPTDGWAYDEHENPEELVQASLQFGANLLVYVFTEP